MNITHIIISVILTACPLLSLAQSTPAIAPSFTYTDSEGNEQTVTSADDQAPLAASFHANATDTEGWNAHYEWHFYLEGQRSNPYLVRYETDTQYTFTKAGTHLVELWATFVQGNDTIAYTDTYWQSEGTPLSISIAESKLEMPNAFSPNGGHLPGQERIQEHRGVPCHYLQPMGTKTILLGRPYRRMGRQIPR